jgi:hypothetical protein
LTNYPDLVAENKNIGLKTGRKPPFIGYGAGLAFTVCLSVTGKPDMNKSTI